MYRGKIIVNRQKLIIVISFIVIIIVNLLVMNSWINNGKNYSDILFKISRVATIEVIVSVICLKKTIKECLTI